MHQCPRGTPDNLRYLAVQRLHYPAVLPPTLPIMVQRLEGIEGKAKPHTAFQRH